MYTINNILNGIFVLSLTIAAVFFVKDISHVIDLIKTIIKTGDNLERWKMGIINLDDIHSLTPREFEYWCGEFISTLGYSNIKQTAIGPDGGKDITCKFNKVATYVECKRYRYDTSADYKVDEQICKKLVGSMVHDRVTHGLIITSGLILGTCTEYVKSLPKEFEINLIDGNKLVELYIRLHSIQQKISA
jgi:HJR/Mrr/RecB family endonuclease